MIEALIPTNFTTYQQRIQKNKNVIENPLIRTGVNGNKHTIDISGSRRPPRCQTDVCFGAKIHNAQSNSVCFLFGTSQYRVTSVVCRLYIRFVSLSSMTLDLISTSRACREVAFRSWIVESIFASV